MDKAVLNSMVMKKVLRVEFEQRAIRARVCPTCTYKIEADDEDPTAFSCSRCGSSWERIDN